LSYSGYKLSIHALYVTQNGFDFMWKQSNVFCLELYINSAKVLLCTVSSAIVLVHLE